ncbi:MAG: tRNA preQ1(34) S-adenosylmethionine ribosyltransferase-isomerase QueA [Phycisphaerales bacterium]|nr:tRNA preQ1(34) S-adenosylmethionine ribosyltransferase-isomerase QueA [Phycisphaerales bacterium]
MKRSELLFDLPEELIAQRPAEPRDASRLLVVERAPGRIAHHAFRELPKFLRSGDCLVVNDTRVVPARFFLRRASGGRVEALFVHPVGGETLRWRVQLKPSARLRVGEILQSEVDRGPAFQIIDRHARGAWTIAPQSDETTWDLLSRIGQTPLPPYINRRGAVGENGEPDAADASRYQTVFASEPGAVAAPTAGLHFTDELLHQIRADGVEIVRITLHVGPGTFAPIDVDDLGEHHMHAEFFSMSAGARRAVCAARARGGRVVAVGTTSARVLETECGMKNAICGNPAAGNTGHGSTVPAREESIDGGISGWTDIFIYPPYRFGGVDALLTNFHLPGGTLIALVMALGGVDLVRRAYAEAIERRYRFYSYGDAMLIL